MQLASERSAEESRLALREGLARADGRLAHCARKLEGELAVRAIASVLGMGLLGLRSGAMVCAHPRGDCSRGHCPRGLARITGVCVCVSPSIPQN